MYVNSLIFTLWHIKSCPVLISELYDGIYSPDLTVIITLSWAGWSHTRTSGSCYQSFSPWGVYVNLDVQPRQSGSHLKRGNQILSLLKKREMSFWSWGELCGHHLFVLSHVLTKHYGNLWLEAKCSLSLLYRNQNQAWIIISILQWRSI